MQQAVVTQFRRRGAGVPNVGPPGPSPMSGLRNSQLPPGAQGPGQPIPPPQGPGAMPQRASKRTSSSPRQEVRPKFLRYHLSNSQRHSQPEQLPRNPDGSPQNSAKRQRRTPPGAEQGQPPMYPLPPGAAPTHMQPPPMQMRPPMQFGQPPPMAGLANTTMMPPHNMTPQMSPMNPPPMNSPGMQQARPDLGFTCTM